MDVQLDFPTNIDLGTNPITTAPSIHIESPNNNLQPPRKIKRPVIKVNASSR